MRAREQQDRRVAMVGDVADEIYTQRGTTQHFVVSYAQSLGANGPTLADAVLATCEADYDRLQGWFGNIAIGGLPFQVFIKPGTGGASHANCAATAMFCDAFNGNGFAPPGAGVAAAHQTSMHQLDAFVVDANGALNVLWVTDEGAWQGPAAL